MTPRLSILSLADPEWSTRPVAASSEPLLTRNYLASIEASSDWRAALIAYDSSTWQADYVVLTRELGRDRVAVRSRLRRATH